MPDLKTKFKQSRNTPFWVLHYPFDDSGRALELLGVAFIDPSGGVNSGYAPGLTQRANHDTTDAEADTSAGASELDSVGPAVSNDKKAAVTLLSKEDNTREGPSDPGHDSGTNTDTASQAGLTTPKSPWWPKDIIPTILPPYNHVSAKDVTFVMNKAKGTEGELRLKEILEEKFGWSEKRENTTTIPIFRRYSMEDPVRNIRNLWSSKHTSYKDEILALFRDKDLQPRELWVATHSIACGELSLEQLHETAAEASTKISDATETVPITIGGKTRYTKESVLKGTYKNDVVLAMAYHKIELKNKDNGHLSVYEKLLGRLGPQRSKDVEVDLKIDPKEAKGLNRRFLSHEDIPFTDDPNHEAENGGDFEDSDWDDVDWLVQKEIDTPNDSEEEDEEDEPDAVGGAQTVRRGQPIHVSQH